MTTAQVAERVGVHRDTLLRWLREGRLPEPGRDRHGWRLFTDADFASVERYAHGQAIGRGGCAGPFAEGVERLKRLDWGFADAKTSYLTHGLHPYPAKFIPQIPNAVIQELSSVGETVADIFCGSGTTLVEALTLKRHAVGVDANPLACLISEAKTTALSADEERGLLELAGRAQAEAERLGVGQPQLFVSGEEIINSTPASPTIEFWFEPFVVEELARIRHWCESLPTAGCRRIALAAFSSIIVAVSKQDSDTRYVRREKGLSPGDAMRRFARALADAARGGREFGELVEDRFARRVHCSDVLQAPDIGPVDLVVCSPPYPNAYSYHLYHMTRMLWLGMDQPSFKKIEIGSHRKYSAKGPKAATIETFHLEMERVFSWLSGALRPGRYACFLVGDSTINGERTSNADILASAASKAGFSEAARIERQMNDSRKAFNPAIGRIKHERLVVLQNRRTS
jgi:site-specific DNA-methyltransferase (cytosine-N4-specific)